MTLVTVPSNPSDIKKIHDAVNEGVDCLTRIASEREALKDIIDMIVEDYEIPKKHVAKMIRSKFKDDFKKQQEELQEFEELWQKIMHR